MSLARTFDRARTFARTYGLPALLRETWGRMRRRFARPGLPDRFHVEISNSCNFSCEYCVLRSNVEGDKLMSDETLDAVLPYLKGASSIALSGLAEPLMHRRFPEILRRVRAVAPHALISIDTNASLLTRAISEDIVSSGLDSLVFSLDGVEEGVVDRIRAGGSLEKVIENVRALNDVKHARKSKRPLLAATMVLQRKNLSQLPAVVDLAASLGVRAVSVNGLEPYAPALVGQATWFDPTEDREALLEAVRDAGRRADAAGVELRLPSPVPSTAACMQVGRPIILADGTVVPCSVLAYHRDRFVRVASDGSIKPVNARTNRVSFGNVNERPLGDIWRDEAYANFRENVLAGNFPHECHVCLMKHNLICPNSPVTPQEFVRLLAETASPGGASR